MGLVHIESNCVKAASNTICPVAEGLLAKFNQLMIFRIFDIDNRTVARGRSELLQRDVEIDRIRKKGGGRLSIKKTTSDH
jgi:hypothetical protein